MSLMNMLTSFFGSKPFSWSGKPIQKKIKPRTRPVEEIYKNPSIIGQFFGEKPFSWSGTPRTRDSLDSQRVRFTYKEYERFISPSLWMETMF